MSSKDASNTSKAPSLLESLDLTVFIFPAVLILLFIVLAFAAPGPFAEGASGVLGFLNSNFAWLYAMGTFAMICFCFWAAFSKYGDIKLGGKDAKPEMSFFSWFAVALTSGIAIGIVFWGVAEPVTFFTDPPGFTGWEPGSVEAAEGVLKFNFLHWGIHPYAIYTTVGLCCAFIILNGKRKFAVSSSLIPLIGDRAAAGTPGKLVDGLAIFALVGGVGTSLGLAVDQFVTGINYVFHTDLNANVIAVAFIAGMALVYIGAAVIGLQKGIKRISNLCMYLYIALLIWGFIFGGTLLIVNNTITSIGQYLAFIIPQSFYLEPFHQTGWVSGWSIFYYAWWLAFAPLVGLFFVKLATGRTIHQFVMVNLVAPVFFAFLWFGVLGTGAINFEMTTGAITAAMEEWGLPATLFIYLEQLPLAPVFIFIGFLIIVFSFVTIAESMTLSLAEMTTKTEAMEQRREAGKDAPNSLKVFWGVLMGAIAMALYYAGGLSSFQASSIVCAFPIVILQCVMIVSFVKSMRHRSEYDMTLTDQERAELAAQEAAARLDQPAEEAVETVGAAG